VALGIVLVILGVVIGAQGSSRVDQQGLVGEVLTPDARPVSSGVVALQSRDGEITSAIDASGRFSIVPHASGPHVLYVVVPGLAPYRVSVTVPPARYMRLPPIRLSAATYYRVRFVGPSGEPLVNARVARQVVDVSGAAIREPRGTGVTDRFEADGTVTIGPLPRGIVTLALDTPPFARMRLPDVPVGERAGTIDAGIVTVQPGTTLAVDVVDANGAAVVNQDVYLEESAAFSPLILSPRQTDQHGRVVFDRLAHGRYVLRTRAADLCGNRRVTVTRRVSVSGTTSSYTRLVVGGTLNLRLFSSGVPSIATNVLVTPESASPPPPAWFRPTAFPPLFAGRTFGIMGGETPCGAVTDKNGRATFDNFPPGPARVAVRLPNSIWTHRIEVSADRREVPVNLPSGFMPLRVVNARTGDGVAGAAITWTSRGGRVEASASANGDALLEGLAAAPGALTIRSRGYLPLEVKQPAPLDALSEHALEPARDASLKCLVVNDGREPIADAVVELTPAAPLDIGQIATTDSKGLCWFTEVPPGPLRLVAWVDGVVVAKITVPADAAGDIILTVAKPSGLSSRRSF